MNPSEREREREKKTRWQLEYGFLVRNCNYGRHFQKYGRLRWHFNCQIFFLLISPNWQSSKKSLFLFDYFCRSCFNQATTVQPLPGNLFSRFQAMINCVQRAAKIKALTIRNICNNTTGVNVGWLKMEWARERGTDWEEERGSERKREWESRREWEWVDDGSERKEVGWGGAKNVSMKTNASVRIRPLWANWKVAQKPFLFPSNLSMWTTEEDANNSIVENFFSPTSDVNFFFQTKRQTWKKIWFGAVEKFFGGNPTPI